MSDLTGAEGPRLPEKILEILASVAQDPPVAFQPNALEAFLALEVEDLEAFERARVELQDSDVSMRRWERALADLRAKKSISSSADSSTYPLREPKFRVMSDGIAELCEGRHATWWERLTNFGAKIVSESLVDDGLDLLREYEIQATVGGKQVSVRTSASEFATMRWVSSLGPSAIVFPGRDTPAKVRTAIQTHSTPETRSAYAHTGWRRQESGSWIYLDAGGAIGADGRVTPPVSVLLPDALHGYRLPDPPADMATPFKSALACLRVAPLRVMAPVLAIALRSVLGSADVSVWLVGRSGAFKSELSALVLRFFGKQLDREHLTLSWDATAAAVELVLHAAKDSLAVLDDYAPRGLSADIAKLEGKADKIIRSVGNRSARARMSPDGVLRPVRAPRCCLLASGEDVPPGASLRARLVVTEAAAGDVDISKLTECQRAAQSGIYASAMAAYVSWLAGRLDAGKSFRLPERLESLRVQATLSGVHRRTPGALANLGVGWQLFLEFGEDIGALTALERTALWAEIWGALGEAAARQAMFQGDEEPAERFVTLLASALSTAQAHLCDAGGRAPPNASRWGWRSVDVGSGQVMRPGGKQIGWVSESGQVYLDPEGSYAAIQSFAGPRGLSVSPLTLRQRLHEAGLLVSVDNRGGKKRFTVRRSLQGVPQREVLHVRLPDFDAPEPTLFDGSGQDVLPGTTVSGSEADPFNLISPGGA